MDIIRRNPSALAGFRPRAFDDQFGRLVEHMFDDFLSRDFLPPLAPGGAMAPWSAQGVVTPRLNVSETATAFEIQAELPGVDKEDVKVAVEHQRVTIEGETRRDSERREGENVLYTERSASRFMRSFTLPTEVDEAGSAARMENGILTLTLPKKAGSEATRIAVQ